MQITQISFLSLSLSAPPLSSFPVSSWTYSLFGKVIHVFFKFLFFLCSFFGHGVFSPSSFKFIVHLIERIEFRLCLKSGRDFVVDDDISKMNKTKGKQPIGYYAKTICFLLRPVSNFMKCAKNAEKEREREELRAIFSKF